MATDPGTSQLLGGAALLMSLGPGCAQASYAAMSGFYIRKFNSSFFITMLLCLLAPQPIVSFLQQSFDAYFDRKYSTEVTYQFRVMMMQITLACGIIAWMFAPVSEWIVLMFGCLIGFLSSSIISSSMQLVAAIGPTYVIYVRLGLTLGGALPTLVFSCMSFHPSSSRSEFQRALIPTVSIPMLAACILHYLHRRVNLFNKAYERLAYGLVTIISEPAETDSLAAADHLLGGDTMARQYTETDPLDPKDAEDGLPFWVKYWQLSSGFMMGIAMCLASKAGFFGTPRLAQTLCLLKLCMDFFGAVLASAVPYVPGFKDGPWHKLKIANFLIVLGLSFVCFAQLFTSVPQMLFMICWCIVFAICIFTNCLQDVTSGSYIKVCERKSVARTNQMINVSATLLGLLVSRATIGSH